MKFKLLTKLKDSTRSFRKIWRQTVLSKKVLLIALCIIVVVVPIIYASLNNPEKAVAWFDETFGYRQTVNITNSGSAQTDFQVSITLNTSALISAGKMQSDCDDIRLTDGNGKLLPLWIETGAKACSTTTTSIWTKLSTIPTTGATVYIYYGNPTVSSVQDGNKVFIFFDDFTATTIDPTKWTQGTIASTSGTSFSQSSGNLVGGNTNRYIQSISTYSGDYAAETRVYLTTAPVNGYSTVGFYASSSNNFGILDHNTTSYYRNDSNWVNFAFNGTSQWSRDVVRIAGTTANYSRTGETSGSYTNSATNSGLSSEYMRLSTRYDDGAYDQNYSATWDWIFIRKTTTTEPSTGTPANEEKSPAPMGYWKFDEGYGVVANNSNWRKTGTTTNLIVNPSFEVNTTDGWSNCSASATRDTTRYYSGNASAKLVAGSGWTTQCQVVTTVANGESASIQARIFRTSNVGVYVGLYDFTNGTWRASTTSYSLLNTWENIPLSWTNNLGSTVSMGLVIYNTQADSTSPIWIDGTQFEKTLSQNLYCDGSLTGNGSHTWSGTSHASTSTCDTGNDGSINGATWQTEDQCISGKCLKLNGTSNYLVGSNTSTVSIGSADSITLSAWIKPNSVSGNQTIFSKGASGSCFNYGITVNSGVLGARNTNGDWGLGSASIIANQWNYITVVYSSSDAKGYVNGKYVGSHGSGTTTSCSDNNWVMGTRAYNSTASEFFNGFIDEMKIYPYARSADQIKADYNSKGSSGSDGSSSSFGGNSKNSDALSNGLVGYWKMDEASWNGTTGEVKDASGNNKNATRSGDATTTSGKYGNGGVFDGTGDNVYNGSKTIEQDNFTVTAWIYLNAISGTQTVFSQGPAYTTRTFLRVNSSGTIEADSGSGWWVTSGINLTAGKWYHVVYSYNSIDKKRIFIDGVLSGTQTTGGASIGDDDRISIASNITGSDYLSGKIDEVRVFNRTLSPSEIQTLYNWAPGPVLYSNFDEGSGSTVNDVSGNNHSGAWHGTGTHWGVGMYGIGGTFDGSSDYVDYGGGYLINGNTQFSLKCNVKVSTSSTVQICGKISDDFSDGYGMVMNGTKADVWFAGSVGQYNMTSNKTISDSKWHDLVLVYDKNLSSNQLKLYIDGILDNSTTTSGDNIVEQSTVSFSVGEIVMGGSGGGFWLQGSVDEVKLYNYARTQKQIVEDMNAGHPSGGSPVGSQQLYWRMDEGYGGSLRDSSPQNITGTLSCFGASCSNPSWSNDAKLDKSLYFSGTGATGSYVTASPVNLGATTGSQITVSTWMKPDTTQNGAGWYVRNGVGADENYGLQLASSPTGGYFPVTMTWYDGNWRSMTTTGYHVPQTTWSQLTVVISQGQWMKVYVNGTFKEQVNWNNSNSVLSTSSLNIGGHAGTTYQMFNGYLDEFKIYTYGLSTDDIKVDYNRGSDAVLGSLSTTSNGITAGNSSERSFCIPGDTSTCNAPIGEWKFDENTGTSSIYDTSGNNRSGTMYGSKLESDWEPGKLGSALKFDGTDDYISLSNYSGLNVSSPGSFSAWVKTTTDSCKPVYSLGHSTTNYAWILYTGDGCTGTLTNEIITIARLNSTTTYILGYTTSTRSELLDGNWHHIYITMNGSTLKLYLDGRERTVTVGSGSNNGTFGGLSSMNNAEIGSRNYNSNARLYFNGQVDELKIYNYTRTPAQVAWDYNRGLPIAHYRMDECSGTILHSTNSTLDSSLDATLSIGGSVTNTSAGTCNGSAGQAWKDGSVGKYGASIELDGADDYAYIADNTILEFGNSQLSIAAWAKINAFNGSSSYTGIFGRGDNVLLTFSSDGAGYPQCWHQDSSSSWFNSTSNQALNTGNWYHMVCTIKSDGKAYLYVNGKEVPGYSAQQTRTNPIKTTGSSTYDIGRYGGAYTNGQIDDLKIYNYPLTNEQIKILFNENSSLRFGN